MENEEDQLVRNETLTSENTAITSQSPTTTNMDNLARMQDKNQKNDVQAASQT